MPIKTGCCEVVTMTFRFMTNDFQVCSIFFPHLLLILLKESLHINKLILQLLHLLLLYLGVSGPVQEARLGVSISIKKEKR